MALVTISVPASIVVTVDTGTDPVPDTFDEETLFDAVVEQHGKYVEVDARNLGFDNADILSVD